MSMPVPRYTYASGNCQGNFPGYSPINYIRNHIKKSPLLSGCSQDREFLPAHLEILETPPSPQRIAAFCLLCGGLSALLLCSCLARLDIFSIAMGRVQVSGRSKVVQPLDPGAVTTIYVGNGSLVNAGDILLDLDPTLAKSDKQARTAEIETLHAEILRRKAAIDAVERGDFRAPRIKFGEEISPEIRLREENVLAAEFAQHLASRARLESEISENEAYKTRLNGSIEARGRLIEVLRERLGIKRELVLRAAGTRVAQLEAQQALEVELTNHASDKGQLIQAAAIEYSLSKKIEQLQKQFIAEQAQRLSDAQRKLDHSREEFAKASFHFDRMTLRAPITGTIQQLAVTTIGQVVTAGQPLMIVVPNEGKVEVEAMVQNTDIGFIEIGQEVTIKVNSFPFTRYGTIEGHVLHISRDAVDIRDSSMISDSANASRTQNFSALSPISTPQNLVFPITISLDKADIMIDGKTIPLGSGMTVTAEIKTGTRSVIEYLLSPIRETASTAGRER